MIFLWEVKYFKHHRWAQYASRRHRLLGWCEWTNPHKHQQHLIVCHCHAISVCCYWTLATGDLFASGKNKKKILASSHQARKTSIPQHQQWVLFNHIHHIKLLPRHKTMCSVFALDTKEQNRSWSAQTCTGVQSGTHPRGKIRTHTRNQSGDKTATSPLQPAGKIRREEHLQMGKRSCLGGRDQAASGTDTPGTLASCTCLHLGASTLKEQRRVSNLMV